MIENLKGKLPIPISEAELILIEEEKARKARKARLRRISKNIARIQLNHNIGVLIPYNNPRSEKLTKAEKKKVVAALAEGLPVHRVVLEYHGLSQE